MRKCEMHVVGETSDPQDGMILEFIDRVGFYVTGRLRILDYRPTAEERAQLPRSVERGSVFVVDIERVYDRNGYPTIQGRLDLRAKRRRLTRTEAQARRSEDAGLVGA